MSVLLPINNFTSLTFRELLECTQLERKDLLRKTQLILDSKLSLTDVSITPPHTPLIILTLSVPPSQSIRISSDKHSSY